MTPHEVREHNETCNDDEIIWCECDEREPMMLACANCGGAVDGVIILTDKVPNDQR